jgi:hypothetical protein
VKSKIPGSGFLFAHHKCIRKLPSVGRCRASGLEGDGAGKAEDRRISYLYHSVWLDEVLYEGLKVSPIVELDAIVPLQNDRVVGQIDVAPLLQVVNVEEAVRGYWRQIADYFLETVETQKALAFLGSRKGSPRRD